LVDEGNDWFKLETPVRLPSYGEYIIIKLGKKEVTISIKPKVYEEGSIDYISIDRAAEVAAFLEHPQSICYSISDEKWKS